MRSKKRIPGAPAPSLTIQNTLPLPPQLCFEGETLARFLKSVQREIESARIVDETLPLKIWIKQQFAVGVNEVTRGLERMPPNRGDEKSPVGKNVDDGEARCGYFQVILVASDCNPRTLTKHLPALAASRNVPLISVRDRKEGSLRLGELIKVKTAIAIGVKAKGNAINQLIKEALTNNKINSTEEEA
ncbi:hypothetical protein SASPL_111863 [Salvia splendens]|uniref:Ribosomal protein eL8/eL30/eS12/Gadd45 domain-containing protein n=1 Tax=Salvia splendens TaxID=180675 RepID=A0A8X9A3Q3_SALSN|nr:uncharacterized protein LOC121798596 [Salvia splendens]KAG6427617.1 hypothetical protein SASPL_111863 [Salvia splendens]